MALSVKPWVWQPVPAVMTSPSDSLGVTPFWEPGSGTMISGHGPGTRPLNTIVGLPQSWPTENFKLFEFLVNIYSLRDFCVRTRTSGVLWYCLCWVTFNSSQ